MLVVLVVLGLPVELSCDVLPHRRDVERSRQAQGPGERPALVGEVDAPRVGVHGGSPARQATVRVGGQPRGLVPLVDPDRDDAQQGGAVCSAPAPHAGADRTRETVRVRVYALGAPRRRPSTAAPPAHAGVRCVLTPRPRAAHAASPGGHSASLWMSIRQPVRRAASRAFWPSLPMASESW